MSDNSSLILIKADHQFSLPGDISKKEDVLRLAREVQQREPNGITLLVNNAGIARDYNTQFSKNEPPTVSNPLTSTVTRTKKDRHLG